MICCEAIILLSQRSHDNSAYTTSILTIIAMFPLKDPSFQSIEAEFVEISIFPKPGKNMKRDVSTSLVSKAGTIFLTTFESKRIQTRPIGRAATYNVSSHANIAKRL